MNQSLKSIANVGAVLLLIALLVPFVVYSAPAVVGADHSFVVITASMTPAIAPGDVVIVDEREAESIAVGDVITFTRGANEPPVTHRVTAITETGDALGFETKGDANGDPDAGVVPAGNVLGTVAFTIPYIGYVIQFTNTPYGFVALVVVPITLLVASEVWTLYRRREATGSDGTAAAADESAENGATPGDDQDGRTSRSGGVRSTRFWVTTRTLEGAAAPLVALTAYSGYMTYIGLTRIGVTAIMIATFVASAGSLLAVTVLLLTPQEGPTEPAHSVEDRPEAADGDRPAADGGVSRPIPRGRPEIDDAEGDG